MSWHTERSRAALSVTLGALGGVLAAAATASPPAAQRADASTWPSFRGDPQLTGVAASDLSTSPGLLWTYQAGGGIESTAAIAEGRVYVGSLDGNLYAVNLNDGSLVWKFSAGASIKSSPSAFHGMIYFGDEDGSFHAVDARTGGKRWSFKTGAAIASSATMASGLVIFGSNRSSLYALRAEDGSVAWRVETGGYVYGAPALVDGLGEAAVASAGCDGFLRVLRARDGSVIRKVELGAYVGASPAVRGTRAFVGTFENEVLGIDLSAGKVLWTYSYPERQFPFYSSAALGDGILVVGG